MIASIRLVKKSISKLKDKDDLSKEPNKLINSILEFTFSSERFFLKNGLRFPIGVSIIAYASRSNKK